MRVVSKQVLSVAAALAVALLAGPGRVDAVPYTFDWSSGDLAAQATFEQVGGNLVLTLANTSTADVLVPTDVLHAVFFSLADAPVLTPVSAVLGVGSTVFYDADGQPAGGVVGGEFAYESGLTGLPGGGDQGISSAGYGKFGQANFPGPNLNGQTAVNGADYGILSAGDDTNTGNAGVTGNPAIKNAVVFTLELPDEYTLTKEKIGNVYFQYGTTLDAIPEPTGFILTGMGMLLFGMIRRRSR
jgi:hypothetical protein